MAEVHVQSWRETYKGIVPDDLLAKLSVEKRKEAWTTIVCNKQRTTFTIVAVDEGKIVGFANGGEPQDKELSYDSELAAIYLLRSHQKRGIGRELFNRFVAKLAQLGPTNMYLWVLTESSTTGFYKHLAGEYVKSDTIVLGGKSLKKDLFLWQFR